MSFSSLGLPAELLRGIADLGWTEPTPIQRDAIPPALDGRDVLACAETGTGKTAAFLLPMLHRLLTGRANRVRALILTPTRELAARSTSTSPPWRSATTPAQRRGDLRRRRHGRRRSRRCARGVDICSSPPRAGCSTTSRTTTRTSSALEVLVLDEADRMLDMGFLPDIRRILAHLPAQRQTLLFSATLPPLIVEAGARDAARPGTINGRAPQPATAVGITQAVYPVAEHLKPALLARAPAAHRDHPALVFTRTKHRADRLAEQLEPRGLARDRSTATAARASATRRWTAFTRRPVASWSPPTSPPAASTSSGISHVINYDIPARPTTTSTASAARRAPRRPATPSRFVTPDEQGDLRAIERAIAHRTSRGNLQGFDYDAEPRRAARGPARRALGDAPRPPGRGPRALPEKAERKAQRDAEEEARKRQTAAPKGGGERRSGPPPRGEHQAASGSQARRPGSPRRPWHEQGRRQSGGGGDADNRGNQLPREGGPRGALRASPMAAGRAAAPVGRRLGHRPGQQHPRRRHPRGRRTLRRRPWGADHLSQPVARDRGGAAGRRPRSGSSSREP